MLEPILVKNDRRARVVDHPALRSLFLVQWSLLGRVEVPVGGAFDVHIFAKFNAIINSIVSVLLDCRVDCS